MPAVTTRREPPLPSQAASSSAADATAIRRSPRLHRWLAGMARAPIIAGILSVFVAATALLAFAVVQTYKLVERLFAPGGMNLDKEDLMLASIKLVDVVLLATVLQIMAIGLYGLFIDSRLPVPAWLRIDHIDALKHKLTGVVIIVLGVVFLEQAISWDGQRNLLPFGVAIAAVVLALSYFLGAGPGKAKASDGDR
jgi:uncharacterized membrane protein YqhA